MSTPTLDALVYAMRWEADGIVSVEFRPASDAVEFPPFDAGSHIDLHLPNGLSRSYSLCNPPTDRGRYVVGVLNDRNSRGGSRYVHQQLRVGTTLPISPPLNNFKLQESSPRSVLIAGGIGVTPIYCMLQHLVAQTRPVELIYCARSRREAAFIEGIEKLTASAVPLTLHFDQEQGGPPDLASLLRGRGDDSHYYCCGPTPMLDAFERTCEQLNYPNAHIERFAAAPMPQTPSHGFEVVCAKSGKTVQVPAGKSILDALIDSGLSPDFSCKEGVCGSCETAVLEFDGELEHHDGILTKLERESGKTMMICVSRCSGKRIELDI